MLLGHFCFCCDGLSSLFSFFLSFFFPLKRIFIVKLLLYLYRLLRLGRIVWLWPRFEGFMLDSYAQARADSELFCLPTCFHFKMYLLAMWKRFFFSLSFFMYKSLVFIAIFCLFLKDCILMHQSPGCLLPLSVLFISVPFLVVFQFPLLLFWFRHSLLTWSNNILLCHLPLTLNCVFDLVILILVHLAPLFLITG